MKDKVETFTKKKKGKESDESLKLSKKKKN